MILLKHLHLNTTMFADDINLHLHPMLKLRKEKLKMKFIILTTGLGQTNCQLITTKPVTLS